MSLLKTNTKDLNQMKTIYSSGLDAGKEIHRLGMLLSKKNRKIERLKQELTQANNVIQNLNCSIDILEGRIDVLSCNVEIPCASPWDC